MTNPSASADRFTLNVKSGDFVFREGESGADFFLIEDGRVELTAPGDQRFTLDVGDFFGERALVSDDPRETTAKALTPCRLVRIDRATFTAIVKLHPEIAVMMLRSLPRGGGGAAPQAKGFVLVHAATGTRFTLDGDDILVGRASKASGFAPDIDLAEFDPDKTLSRKHARVQRTPDGYFLREDEGRNGTFVNGDRVGPGQTVRLEEGDRVRFGLVEVVFRSQ